MKILLLVLLISLLPAVGFAANERWIVYYGDKLPASAFAAYDVIVFDSDAHPDLKPLKGKTLLGYVSLGEAENYRSYFNDLKKQKLLLGDNKAWKGHAVIDIRKPEWKAYVLDKLIPATLKQGFNGVMLDTIDSPLALERDDAKKYRGMHEAAADLIVSIRSRYPEIKIMLNRGFEVLPQVAEEIDMVMAETIYTDWQPGRKNPVIQPKEHIDAYGAILTEIKHVAPAIKIYTVDYWPAKDTKEVKAIYAHQREAGFIPYVAPTLDLQTIGSESL
jgi:uncharacterized protein (TIGR01370 family)